MNPSEIVNSISPRNPSGAKGWNAFRRFFDIWGDPEKRDTSGWNNYYYFYRQIAQHTATVSLKRMKWIAVIFQIYFFSPILLPFIVHLILGKTDVMKDLGPALAIGPLAPPVILALIIFLLPMVMVTGAFKLKHKNRGLMTSRAKEPPLLAHLSGYTTNSGVVAGALQSLFYTWCKLVLYMLPAIAGFAVLWILAVLTPAGENGPFGWIAIIYRVVNVVLVKNSGILIPCFLFFLATVSMFLSMQFFCYRLDTLLLMIFVGWVGVDCGVTSFFDHLGGAQLSPLLDFAITLFIPVTLFAMAYFPLAAADTMVYGLGKQAKWLRILQLLMVLSGIAIFVGINTLSGEVTHIVDARELALEWTALGVFGLLADSVTLATPYARNLCGLRSSKTFLLKCFDVTSPLSLIPIVILEWIVLVASVCLLGDFSPYQYGSFALDISYNFVPTIKRLWDDFMQLYTNRNLRLDCGLIMLVWSLAHLALGYLIRRRRNDPQVKEAWNVYAMFNGIVMLPLLVAFLLFGNFLRGPIWIISFHLISIAVMFILARERKPSSPKRKDSAEP